MRLRSRIAPVVVAGLIGVFAVAATATGAGAATVCTPPGSATDYRTPTGGIDIAAYTAAVSAYNACLEGAGTATPTATPAASSPLAFTGGDPTELAAFGVALAGIGAGALVLSRHRRRVDATAGTGQIN
jgi:hypothetical protein